MNKQQFLNNNRNMNQSLLYANKSFFSIIKLVIFFSCLNSSSHAAIDSFLTCLQIEKTPDSIIYTPQNLNYTHLLQERIRGSHFNTSTALKPSLILTPFHDSHVAGVVKCAKKAQLPLCIRSGGHDFEGLSYTSKTSFVILDMFNLSFIEIDVAAATAWVGAGATVGQLYYRIWEKSKTLAFPAGVCPTMGIGGHLSGGGYGNLLRKYGLSVDNVVDAKVVDVEGRILDLKAMGEDLFWAIRGGGGASFAVVLSYKIKLVPVPPVVTVFQVSKTVEENATGIVHRWQFVADKFDNDLFVRVNLGAVDEAGGKKTVQATFIAMYLGNSEKLLSTMKTQFPELGLKKEECKEMSWIRSVLFWAEFPAGTPETVLLNPDSGPPTFIKIKSDYVTSPITFNGLELLFQRIIAIGNSLHVKFNPYGGRMSEILASSTPFPHRAGMIYKIQYFIMWNEVGAEDKYIGEMRKFYDFMSPYVSKNPRRAYLNYRDIDVGSTSGTSSNAYDDAKEFGIKYFGENFDRLVRIKTVVDPTNFFKDEQSIPPRV